jgi:RNA polymerase sigma factor (sigma-70 family)
VSFYRTLVECYLNVWRIASNYRASLSPPLGWMSVIVRSRSLDLLRKLAAQPDVQRAWKNGKTQPVDDEQVLEIASSDVSALDGLMASQAATGLQTCLEKIETQQREVIVWAYFRDKSHSELAAKFDLPIGTVKTCIRRGLSQLKACMASFA